MKDAYKAFLDKKKMLDPATGIKNDIALPDVMFPFQRDITRWALRRGRAALFAGTGLGKSLMELAWADTVHRETGRDILHLAPLAVTAQMVREGQKFGIEARHVKSQAGVLPGTSITNYQKLDHFDLSKFGGVILDESSILKSVDGHFRTRLIEECATIPFRLAATATPAPNDFMELGNHAEFLGVMSYTDMLASFFTHDGGDTQKWRLKGHAEDAFWKWMASWAVLLRKPSDLGYQDGGFDLPLLNQTQHSVKADYAPSMDTGLLFPMQATSLQERISARRDTIEERVRLAVSIVIGSYWVKLSECHGNQNTKLTDAQKLSAILSMQPNSKVAAVGRQKKTANTCASTIRPISTNGTNEPLNSVSVTTPLDEKDTRQIQNTPSNIGITRAQDQKKSGETKNLSLHSELERRNTTPSLSNRAEDAPFAASGAATPGDINFTSTIVTRQDPSEASFAVPATLDLGSSETKETCSPAPSNISTNLILDPWVIWCHLNKEQDVLKASFGDLAISIHGGHSEEEKEQLHQDWLDSKAPILICKPSMFGHGLNWQHCSNMVFVGLNDSFEQVFQAIRRCWRFGQKKPVNVHFIAAETEGAVVANLRRKELDAERMAGAMVKHMADLSSKQINGTSRDIPYYTPQSLMKIPSWLEEVE